MAETTLATVTGSGGTITIGGVTYLVNRITIGDAGKVDAFVRQMYKTPLQLAREAVEGLPSDVQIEVLNRALRDTQNWSGPTHDQTERALNTIEGVALIFHLLVHQRHPEITYQRALDILNAEEIDLAQVQAELDRVRDLDQGDTPADPLVAKAK